MVKDARDITALLMEAQEGEGNAVDALYPVLYEELHHLAKRQLYRERGSQTLSPTALVHEAYFKLVDQKETDWENRAHFLGIASLVMRRIIITYVRKQKAAKRGGDAEVITLIDGEVARETPPDQLLALDGALDRLSRTSERASRVVTMRFFGDLKQDEIAEALGVSVPTVQRDWQTARAWLSRELSG